MERLFGRTLQSRLAAGPMRIETAIDAAAQIATGLETIHRAGLVHSDIKPANLFITESGRTKILDFGLATAADGPADAARRRLDHAVLVPARYISPERLRRAPVAQRRDLFSL